MSTVLTRRHWLALGAGVVLCGLAATGPRLFPLPAAVARIDALTAERATLSLNDDVSKNLLAERLAAVQPKAWSDARFEALKARLGSEWRWHSDATGNGYRCATLELAGFPLARWSALVVLVDELEREPGLTVVAAEIAATGAGEARRFVAVRLSIRLRSILYRQSAQFAKSQHFAIA